MAISRRYAAMAIVAGAALVMYLAHSTDYRPLTGPNRFSASQAPPYTAAIVYLLSVLPGPRSPERLFESLARMQMNIPWRHQWPVLLLHAGAYDTLDSQSEFLNRLRDSADSHGMTADATARLVNRIEFVTTHHELPEGVPATGGADEPVWPGEWPAYQHMCAFYSYKIFSHPRIKDLTYYLRLDDDSSILEPTCIDPFEYMHVQNKSYAFRHESPDMGWVTEGMWPFVNNYAARHPDVEQRLASNGWEWPPNRVWPGKAHEYGLGANFPSYETNFDLVKLSRFRTPEMTEFLAELASDPRRFYWYRWGDAPVRMAEVSMFLDVKTEVHQMCEIRYAHKTFVFEDCECVPLP
ncbi:glycosyltransferase family 15 protein [Mycena maculata]|uniref:Glycosyltransferase family 15 protein n=1 Tax=Mycena maculata TaxID=230809 RepID=A0AAD7J0V1_9AGAR|nr:glycosyltransferase family 15 protein [Mycena maculata]